MMRCNVVLKDGSYINIPADRMEIVDNTLRVWDGEQLMAVVEITAVVAAHLSVKGELRGN